MNDPTPPTHEHRHPAAGERVLGCHHGPDLQNAHYFYLQAPITFVAVDGDDSAKGEAHWVILCAACFTEYGEDLAVHLEAGRVPIGCDMLWPEDYSVAFRGGELEQLEDADAARAQAEAELEAMIPEGYARTFVRPPWANESARSSGCRGCGTHDAEKWAVATLVRVNDRERSACFTFVMTCASCTTDEARLRELADRAFASQ